MRELFLLSAAVSGALTVIMLLFLWAHRRQEGFRLWTAGTALVSLTYLFSGLRGQIPTVLSVILVNIAVCAVAPMFLDGVLRFLVRRKLAAKWYALALVPFGACLYFLFVRDDIVARTLVLMTAPVIPFLATAILAFRHRPANGSVLHAALAGQFVALSASMAGRGVWVLGQPGFSLMFEAPAQYAFFGATVVLHLGITVTFILLVTERAQAELAGTQAELEARVEQLQQALAEVKTLEGLLPICAACKRIRDEEGTWTQVEVYVRDHTQVEFSHGYCPDCLPKYFPQVSACKPTTPAS